MRLWDAQSGAELRRLEGHGDWVRSVAFSPDGARLASGAGDGTVRLWDASGRTRVSLYSLPDGWVAYTPSGRFRTHGDIGDAFWHLIGLCRFAPGELDEVLDEPLRVREGEPLLDR